MKNWRGASNTLFSLNKKNGRIMFPCSPSPMPPMIIILITDNGNEIFSRMTMLYNRKVWSPSLTHLPHHHTHHAGPGPVRKFRAKSPLGGHHVSVPVYWEAVSVYEREEGKRKPEKN